MTVIWIAQCRFEIRVENFATSRLTHGIEIPKKHPIRAEILTSEPGLTLKQYPQLNYKDDTSSAYCDVQRARRNSIAQPSPNTWSINNDRQINALRITPYIHATCRGNHSSRTLFMPEKERVRGGDTSRLEKTQALYLKTGYQTVLSDVSGPYMVAQELT